jgi:ribosomal-protein-alanine N-acetyltransferase
MRGWKTITPIAPVASLVTLRRARLDDARALADLLCPEISCWLAEWPESMDEAFARQRISRELAEAADGSSLPLVIELWEEGRDPVVAGWCRLRLAPQGRDLALMTCWIGTAFQGRGVAKGAVTEALRLAGPELGVSRAGAYAMRGNKRSIRVLEECGLDFIGERAVPLPARGRVETLLVFERRVAAHVQPMRNQPLQLPVAA